jgi:hypothetical protein
MANTTIPVELSSTPGIVDNSNATAITIDSSENVGIGTSSPVVGLHVTRGGSGVPATSGTAQANGTLRLSSLATSGVIDFGMNSSNPWIQATDSGGLNNNYNLNLNPNGGNVGIGNSSASSFTGAAAQNLVVGSGSGHAGMTIYSGTTSVGGLAFGDGTAAGSHYRGLVQYRHAEDAMLFYTGEAERMRIDNNGNIRINNTGTNANHRVVIQGTSTAASGFSFIVADSAGTDLFNIRNDGAIYTGGGANSPRYLTIGTAANLVVHTDGYLYKSTSSRRYKNTITDATHGLTELLTLRPVTYKGNGEIDGDTVFGGLIAEEVHDAGLTEFVVYNEENEPDALAYSNMVSLCVKAIQEQQTIIESLTARITTLEG